MNFILKQFFEFSTLRIVIFPFLPYFKAMSLELRPERRKRRSKGEDKGRRAALVEEYYRLVSTHPSHLIASRPSSAASIPVVSREPVLPSVVRASTPFDSLRTASRSSTAAGANAYHNLSSSALGMPQATGASATVIPSFTDDADRPLTDFQPSSVRPPSSILMRHNTTLTQGAAPVGRLVCMVRDQPLSYYNSPLRRAAGSRLKAAVLLQRASVTSSTPTSPLRSDPPRKPTPTERLNALLRCSSRSQY